MAARNTSALSHGLAPSPGTRTPATETPSAAPFRYSSSLPLLKLCYNRRSSSQPFAKPRSCLPEARNGTPARVTSGQLFREKFPTRAPGDTDSLKRIRRPQAQRRSAGRGLAALRRTSPTGTNHHHQSLRGSRRSLVSVPCLAATTRSSKTRRGGARSTVVISRKWPSFCRARFAGSSAKASRD